MNKLHSAAQREQLRTSAQELLTGADALLDAAEREARDLNAQEHARFRSLVERANFLTRKASGEVPEPADQRSRLFRALTFLAHCRGNRITAERVARETGDPEAGLIIKAAASGADTATSAWAGVIVAPAVGEFIPLLRGRSALYQLATPAPLVGSATYPRMAAGSASGFVAEGEAIPAKANSLDSITLANCKAAGLVVVTSELFRRADALAESAVLDPLADDVALGVDQVFLSNAAAVAQKSPAGIFHADNAAAAIAATAGGTAAACAADLAKLLTAGASFVAPRLLIRPDAIAAAIALVGASDYPVITALTTERIGRVQIVPAANLPAIDTVALVDAEGLLVAGEGLQIDLSTNAVIHADDTAPAADPLTQASGGVSLYQRDMVAIAVKLGIGWRSKRTAQVQWISGATWC